MLVGLGVCALPLPRRYCRVAYDDFLHSQEDAARTRVGAITAFNSSGTNQHLRDVLIISFHTVTPPVRLISHTLMQKLLAENAFACALVCRTESG